MRCVEPFLQNYLSLSVIFKTAKRILLCSLCPLSPSPSLLDSDLASDRPDPHADPALPGEGVSEEADQ